MYTQNTCMTTHMWEWGGSGVGGVLLRPTEINYAHALENWLLKLYK